MATILLARAGRTTLRREATHGEPVEEAVAAARADGAVPGTISRFELESEVDGDGAVLRLAGPEAAGSLPDKSSFSMTLGADDLGADETLLGPLVNFGFALSNGPSGRCTVNDRRCPTTPASKSFTGPDARFWPAWTSTATTERKSLRNR